MSPIAKNCAAGKLNPVAAEFATFGIIEAMSRVKCGFELETQSVNGATMEDGDDSFDESGYDDAVNDLIEDMLGPSFDMLGIRTQEAIRNMMEDNICSRDLLDRSSFYTSNSAEWESILPRGVEAVQDGSVRGPELVTDDGGVTAGTFSRLLRKLCELDLEVDTGCSFHVHLSLPGVRHKYGKGFQRLLTEYLIINWARVPESVRARWADRSSTHWYKPTLSADKYTFVHFHPQGTWEFRCFGNVASHQDGMRCLRLAVEALQYAYRVQLGLADSINMEVKEGFKLYQTYEKVGTVPYAPVVSRLAYSG